MSFGMAFVDGWAVLGVVSFIVRSSCSDGIEILGGSCGTMV